MNTTDERAQVLLEAFEKKRPQLTGMKRAMLHTTNLVLNDDVLAGWTVAMDAATRDFTHLERRNSDGAMVVIPIPFELR